MTPVSACAGERLYLCVCARMCGRDQCIAGRGYEARCALIGCSDLKVPQIQTSLSSSFVRLQQTSGP